VKLRNLLGAVLLLASAGVCVRLGVWQVSRLHQKQALNAALREALAAPPLVLGAVPAPLDSVRHRRVRIHGRFDERHQLLLVGRSHDGSPGVDVVTPLMLEGGSAVLVDRGWLFAGDAATARPQEFPEPGWHEVVGIADSLSRGRGGAPLRTLEADSVTVWTARWMDLDSLAVRFPYRIAPYTIRQLPGEDVPEHPARSAPRPLDESMHVSYAAQWFLFAAILVFGPAVVAFARRRAARGPKSDLDIPTRPDGRFPR
jgi:surfeit locus 1 family protein